MNSAEIQLLEHHYDAKHLRVKCKYSVYHLVNGKWKRSREENLNGGECSTGSSTNSI